MSDAPALTICRFSRPLSWLRFALGGVISAIALVSVNAESPSDLPEGVSDSVGEWEWLWDEQTLTGAFDVPSTYYDRRHGRTYMRGAVTLRYQLRIPEDRERIRGIIVLVPGLDQHSGRYRHIVNEFKAFESASRARAPGPSSEPGRSPGNSPHSQVFLHRL
jgi:hypothetical protein